MYHLVEKSKFAKVKTDYEIQILFLISSKYYVFICFFSFFQNLTHGRDIWVGFWVL